MSRVSTAPVELGGSPPALVDTGCRGRGRSAAPPASSASRPLWPFSAAVSPVSAARSRQVRKRSIVLAENDLPAPDSPVTSSSCGDSVTRSIARNATIKRWGDCNVRSRYLSSKYGDKRVRPRPESVATTRACDPSSWVEPNGTRQHGGGGQDASDGARVVGEFGWVRQGVDGRASHLHITAGVYCSALGSNGLTATNVGPAYAYGRWSLNCVLSAETTASSVSGCSVMRSSVPSTSASALTTASPALARVVSSLDGGLAPNLGPPPLLLFVLLVGSGRRESGVVRGVGWRWGRDCGTATILPPARFLWATAGGFLPVGPGRVVSVFPSIFQSHGKPPQGRNVPGVTRGNSSGRDGGGNGAVDGMRAGTSIGMGRWLGMNLKEVWGQRRRGTCVQSTDIVPRDLQEPQTETWFYWLVPYFRSGKLEVNMEHASHDVELIARGTGAT